MRIIRAIVLGLAVVIVATAIFGYFQFDVPRKVSALTSMSAKFMCSAVFVGGRDPATVFDQDFRLRTSPSKYVALTNPVVDRTDRSVTSTLWGLFSNKAIYRDGIGCTPVMEFSEAEIRAQGAGAITSLAPPDPTLPWPDGDATLIAQLPPDIDASKLQAALDAEFAESDPEKPNNTRAVVVVFRDRIVAERYAPTFTKDTPLHSASMAKSVTNALIGILLGQGKLQLYAPAPVLEWKDPGDPRHAITLDNLLRMKSGLSFNEDYSSPDADPIRQLNSGDLAAFAAAKPLESVPGEKWAYRTGTSNILGRIVRQTAGATFAEGFAFPRHALFDPIGMRTATLEVDAAGSFQGGSFFYASARDYARLALLFLRDGVWNGERILPEGWVAYSITPTPNEPGDSPYGAHFWLNQGPNHGPLKNPDVPADTFFMSGLLGQSVATVPSRDAIVVRLGLSEFRRHSTLLKDVLDALPVVAAPTFSPKITEGQSRAVDPQIANPSG